MSRFADGQDATELYRQAVCALRELCRVEGPGQAMRASAQVLSTPMWRAFTEDYSVSRGVPCALRLVQHCQHDPGDQCEPPGSDHSSLLLRNRRPDTFVTQPYSLDGTTLRQMLDYADEHGLKVSISGISPHFPGKTLLVMMHRNTD